VVEGTKHAPRFVAFAASSSWLLPLTALLLLGFSERGRGLLDLAPERLVLLSELSAVLGLALGVGAILGIRDGAPRETSFRRAVLGTGASVLVLLVAESASITGAVSAHELRDALDHATRELSGWNGNARVEGATLFAVEIDPTSRAARILLPRFDRPFRIVMVGVDNVGGHGSITVDVEGARALRAGGAAVNALSPRELAASAARGSGTDPGPSTLTVPGGGSLDHIMVLYPPESSLRDVRWIELRVNGTVRRIAGRYFTADEKRAIDERRRQEGGPAAALPGRAR